MTLDDVAGERGLLSLPAMEETCPVCGGSAANERPYVTGPGHETFAGRSVAVCATCSLRFCSPMPATDELDRYYESGSYDSGQRSAVDLTDPWSTIAMRAVAQTDFTESVLGRPARSWLDVGAGMGMLLDEAHRRGADTAGVEPTPRRLAGLVERGHRAWPTDDEVAGTFEVVSFSHVLEHVNDPVAFISEAVTKLDDEGVLFCEVPHVPVEEPGTDEPHVLFFTADTLATTFEAAGTRIRRIGEAGWRRGPGLHRQVRRFTTRAKDTGRLPVSLTRLDSIHRYGAGQQRAFLRCVASPA